MALIFDVPVSCVTWWGVSSCFGSLDTSMQRWHKTALLAPLLEHRVRGGAAWEDESFALSPSGLNHDSNSHGCCFGFKDNIAGETCLFLRTQLSGRWSFEACDGVLCTNTYIECFQLWVMIKPL